MFFAIPIFDLRNSENLLSSHFTKTDDPSLNGKFQTTYRTTSFKYSQNDNIL